MRVSKEVVHHLNIGGYEFTEVRASVQVDVDDDANLADLGEELTDKITELMAPEIDSAAAIAPSKSYIHTYYN